MTARILTFPAKRPDKGPPGYAEARQIIARFGPALAVRIAEYILIDAVFDLKERINHKPVPHVLARHGIDLSMATRSLANLFDLFFADRKAFNKVERAYCERRKALAAASKKTA